MADTQVKYTNITTLTKGIPDRILTTEISDDGRYVIYATHKGVISCYDIYAHRDIWIKRDINGRRTWRVKSIRISSNLMFVATLDVRDHVCIRMLLTGSIVAVFTDHTRDIVFSRDSNLFAMSANVVKIYKTHPHIERTASTEYRDCAVCTAAFSNSNKHVLYCCDDRIMSIYDIERSSIISKIKTIGFPVHVSYSPDDRYILLLTDAVDNIDIYDSGNMHKTHCFSVKSNITCIHFAKPCVVFVSTTYTDIIEIDLDENRSSVIHKGDTRTYSSCFNILLSCIVYIDYDDFDVHVYYK